MPEKEVSVRQQVVIEVPNDVAFRQNVEVDQNVAAENYIHALHERHARVIEEVEASECDAAFLIWM